MFFRTISYWDLEKMSLISSSTPEGFGIRKILFHPEGGVIFSASQDSLRVHSWEPNLQLDYLSVPWGKIDSMQLSENQIVGVVRDVWVWLVRRNVNSVGQGV